jgi:purine-nucleoside phosphorylase
MTLMPRPPRPEIPCVALVLGSGLGALAERTEQPQRIPFHDLPGLAATTVPGHNGFLTVGKWAGKRVLVFEGRVHFYEGHSWQTVLAPLRIAQELGARAFLTTNAAGGIRSDLEPGRLMVLSAHIDWTCPFTWRQPARANPYSSRLVSLLQKAGRHVGQHLPAGTYAQVTGPCYETPAEIRALRSVGADAVGMSTAREIQAGFDMGLECAALSCITNRAAGLGSGPVNHEEVLASTAQQRESLAELLEAFLADIDLVRTSPISCAP